jgi:glycosyltransferase involved in cell wall biosynthesis
LPCKHVETETGCGKPKLNLVTQGFPYGENERGFLPTELEALLRSFQVTLLAFDNGEDLRYPLAEGVTYRRYTWPAGISVPRLLAQLRFPEVRADVWHAIRTEKANLHNASARILTFSLRAQQIRALLRALIREQHIDVVYTYWCVQATVAALRLKTEFPSLKVVTRFHGADLYIEQANYAYQPLRRYIAAGCDRLLYVCRTGLEYFLSLWDGPWRDKAQVAYIGSRPLPRCEGLRLPGEALGLISCSSLIPLKRVSLILEALVLLPAELAVDWHLLGDGELRADLEKQAQELQAAHPNIHCTFHGHVPNPELTEAYRKAKAQLFITTSESEGLPVSMMEAYSMGIPAIATAVGGIPEILTDGQIGFLLPANPAAADVAGALERYGKLSQEERATLSQNAYACWQTRLNAEENAESLVRTLSDVWKGEGCP